MSYRADVRVQVTAEREEAPNLAGAAPGAGALSPLDMFVPPCYIAFAWATEDALDAPGLVSRLAAVLGQQFPQLCGRLCVGGDGLWRLEAADPPTPFVVRLAECPALTVRQAVVDGAPPLGLAPLLELSPGPGDDGVVRVLLAAQLTRFACGGYVVSLSAHHRVLDGAALVHLGTRWLGHPPLPPVSVVFGGDLAMPAAADDVAELTPAQCGGFAPFRPPASASPAPAATGLEVTCDAATVQEAVAAARAQHPDVSVNDVVCAALWIAYARAHAAERAAAGSGPADVDTEVGFVVDVRRSLSSDAFLMGNGVLYTTVVRPETEVASLALPTAAVLMRRALEAVRAPGYAQTALRWMQPRAAGAFPQYTSPILRAIMGTPPGVGISNWAGISDAAYAAGMDTGGPRGLLRFFAPPAAMAMHGLAVVLPRPSAAAPPENVHLLVGVRPGAAAQALSTALTALLNAAVAPAATTK